MRIPRTRNGGATQGKYGIVEKMFKNVKNVYRA